MGRRRVSFCRSTAGVSLRRFLTEAMRLRLGPSLSERGDADVKTRIRGERHLSPLRPETLFPSEEQSESFPMTRAAATAREPSSSSRAARVH